MIFLKNIINQYKIIITFFIIFIILSSLIVFFTISPANSPSKENNSSFTIEKGESIRQVSKKLEEQNYIKSSLVFNFLMLLTDDGVVAGDYLFNKPQNVFIIVRRFAQGDFQYPIQKITLTEGMTVKEMSEKISSQIPNFDKEKFLSLAIPREGYLFPDTYKIQESIKPEELILLMEENFYKKIEPIEEIIKSSKYPLKEIIIMASIIEKEATFDSMQEISNILWKRVEINMPLQVDASFVYERGKHTFELTLEDLKTDSPYNTYTRYGLTPTPISNPGIQAIKTAASPQSTKNLYFLTGYDGKMYYAKNLEEHKINRNKYLK